jgi:hypothetical protein
LLSSFLIATRFGCRLVSCGIDFVPRSRTCEVRVFRKRLPRVVARTIQVGNEGADNKKAIYVCGFYGLHGSRRNLLVVHGFSAPRGFALLLFPCVELGETAVIVMTQAAEVVEGYHLQVRPGKNVR